MASTSWFWFKKDRSPDNDEEPDRACFFTYKELKKATDNFSKKIGEGGYGDVYKGKLQNKRTVAVKKLKLGTKKSYEQFNNEAKLLSDLRHQNLVIFYGCTKPHEELLLVYEFVPNNTLKYHLHDQQLPFVLPLRIQIAIQIAEGLSYLQSANPPVIHRDVKTDNVLLDHTFHAKVADFGLSRLLPADETDITTITPSTQGYEDPEYRRCLKFTLKSDVYSFGVVLVELISRKKAVDIDRGPGNIFLEEIAPNIIMNKELEQLVDPDIGYHSNADARRIIDLVAELALKCLQPTGEMRPPMVEVLRVLKDIYYEMQHLPIFQEVISKIAQVRQKEFKARIYLYEELEKATDSFHPSRLLGKGSYGETYIGKLPDGQTVAVKKLFVSNQSFKRFFNGIDVLYQYRHQNLVTFYGCTNPQDTMPMPLLVHEFVSDGNLFDHLCGQKMLTWKRRIQIALEAAEALVYLHSLWPQVIHTQFESRNILLDDALHAKVAGLGMQDILPSATIQLPRQLVSIEDAEHNRTLRHTDAEHNRTLRHTEKSNVYCFGVVLMELISWNPSIDVERVFLDRLDGLDFAYPILKRNYDIHVILGSMDGLDQSRGWKYDKDVIQVLHLACDCLHYVASNRPSMVEVLNFLKGIQDGRDM